MFKRIGFYLSAAAVCGLTTLSSIAVAQTQAKPGVELPKPTPVTAVNVVCMAANPMDLMSFDMLIDLALDLFGGWKEPTDLYSFAREFEVKQKKLLGEANGFRYLPLGTGFVVGQDQKYVLTNFHVGVECGLKENKRQLGILENSGGSLKLTKAKELINLASTAANAFPQAICAKSLDNCPKNGEALYEGRRRDLSIVDYLKAIPKNESSSAKALREKRERAARLWIAEAKFATENIRHWAPDLMLLQTDEPLKALPVTFSTAALLPGAALVYSGFPDAAQRAKDSTAGRSAPGTETTPSTAAATFSQIAPISNALNAVGVLNVVNLNLMELGGASALPGSSGGPVYGSATGHVYGIMTQSLFSNKAPLGISYAIPTSEILSFLSLPVFAGIPLNVSVAKPPSVNPIPIIRPATPIPPIPKWWEIQRNQLMVAAGVAAIAGLTFFGFKRFSPANTPTRPPEKLSTPTQPVYFANIRCMKMAAKMPGDSLEVSLPFANGKIRDLIVGREESSCNVLFPDSETKIGNIHCKFSFDAVTDTLTVKDLNSKHGTFVNNKRLASGEEKRLAKSDLISLTDEGKYVFMYVR
jgi:FHA domain/Trypsin-like peptidase domain